MIMERRCCCAYNEAKRRNKERCKRLRQNLVFNPETEVLYEPYMQVLEEELNVVSDNNCDSKVELPWKDIALSVKGMKIRNIDPKSHKGEPEGTENAAGKEDESDDRIRLPWSMLLVTETVQQEEKCDSTVEIPWNDLTVDKPIEIEPSEKEECEPNDLEIPWDELMLPKHIVIQSNNKKKARTSCVPVRCTPRKGIKSKTTCRPCGLYPKK